MMKSARIAADARDLNPDSTMPLPKFRPLPANPSNQDAARCLDWFLMQCRMEGLEEDLKSFVEEAVFFPNTQDPAAARSFLRLMEAGRPADAPLPPIPADVNVAEAFCAFVGAVAQAGAPFPYHAPPEPQLATAYRRLVSHAVEIEKQWKADLIAFKRQQIAASEPLVPQGDSQSLPAPAAPVTPSQPEPALKSRAPRR
jgi:hypothetical protein